MKNKKVKFGYGIVDKDGKPFWDDACVCEDRQTLETEVVPALNEIGVRDHLVCRQPFRVVTLWRMAR